LAARTVGRLGTDGREPSIVGGRVSARRRVAVVEDRAEPGRIPARLDCHHENLTGDSPMAPKFEIEEVVDSLATISEILFLRLKTMECNQCQPCGEVFMRSLDVLRKAGQVAPEARE
jgi:hypothetical protein